MGNLFLLLTILAETIAVIFMKLSDGFSHKGYAAGAVITYALSFIFLTMALKYLPAGMANAIWAGASTVLVAIIGVLLLHEKLTTVQLISLLLIVIGLAGLNLGKQMA